MSWLSDLLQGIPLNAVLKERVALAEQKFQAMDAQNKALADQVEKLTAANEQLRQDLADRMAADSAAAKPPRIKWGCYVCPACYDTTGKKCLTTRLDVHFRACLVCKAKIDS